MKVNVTKAGHFAKVDGVMTELKTGEQDIANSLAESMIKAGYAINVEAAKPQAKTATKAKSKQD